MGCKREAPAPLPQRHGTSRKALAKLARELFAWAENENTKTRTSRACMDGVAAKGVIR